MNSRQLVILTQEYAPFPALRSYSCDWCCVHTPVARLRVMVIASAYSEMIGRYGRSRECFGGYIRLLSRQRIDSGGSLRSHVGILSSAQ